jgi:hypothetical protein
MAPTPPAGGARAKLGALPFVIAGLSFIPLVGVPFGVVAIVWSIATGKVRRLTLGLIGAGGILFTVVLYGGLFYFVMVQHGGVDDRLRAELARQQLYTLVQAVEFYNLQYGSYPETLTQLREALPKQSFVGIFDPTDFRLSGPPRNFYYERSGPDHYYLRGVGPDGTPFTADDILPEITIPPTSRIGLLLNRPANSAPATNR